MNVDSGTPSTPEAAPRRCSQCNKAAGPDVRLQKCSGCLAVRYCSQTCQEAAWPFHKARCRLLKRVIGGVNYNPDVQPLRDWCDLHRAPLATMALRRLGLDVDDTAGGRQLLVIYLRSRPTEPVEKRYFITDTVVHPFDDLPQAWAGRLHEEYAQADAEARAHGSCTFYTLTVPRNACPNLTPHTYHLGERMPPPNCTQEDAIRAINDGMVIDIEELRADPELQEMANQYIADWRESERAREEAMEDH